MVAVKPIQIKTTNHMIKQLFVKEVTSAEPTNLKTPILMVHGACHGWWAYHKWLPFFATCGWRAYAMSLRNHTGSYEVPQEAFQQLTVNDYAEDVIEVLNWLDQPAILIGHSMGGISVQKAAEQANLKALILLASVGPGQLGKIRDPLPVNKPFMFTAAEARKIWFHSIDDESFDMIYQQMVPESVGVMNHYSSGTLRINHKKVGCPTLVIGAEHDHTVVHHYQRIADFYACDRWLVPNAGHDFMLEPAAINVAIKINYWLLSVLTDEGLLFPNNFG